jgi:surface protein
MSGMFRLAKQFNQPLNDWEVGNVIKMSDMFNEAQTFNQPLEKWNVTKVTDMSRMFEKAECFNHGLEDWEVGNVTNMSGMFRGCSQFNQSLSEWNLPKVRDMSSMFQDTKEFDQAVDDWDVGNVSNMSNMFDSACKFNQPLGKWNVTRMRNMSAMFQNTPAFNQPLGDWDVSNVTNMSLMFSQARSFNQPLSRWNVVNVTDMSGMFQCAAQFNQSLEDWNVLNLMNTKRMLFNSRVSVLCLQKWNVLTGRDLIPLPAAERLTQAIRDVTDVESAKECCNSASWVDVFDDVQINHQVAELWMQFLVHLSTFVGGEDIVKCFSRGYSGSMTYCIILTAYLHPSTEGLVFQFFKNILCDTRGQILERQEIRTLAREIYNNMSPRAIGLGCLCSSGSLYDLKSGALFNVIAGFGCLSGSPKFRENMRRSPDTTIAKLRNCPLSEKSAVQLIASLPSDTSY